MYVTGHNTCATKADRSVLQHNNIVVVIVVVRDVSVTYYNFVSDVFANHVCVGFENTVSEHFC